MDDLYYDSHFAPSFLNALEKINTEHFVTFPISSLGTLPLSPEQLTYEGAIYSNIEELPKILKKYTNLDTYIDSVIGITNNAIAIINQLGIECISVNINYKTHSHIFWHSDFYNGNTKNPEYFQYYALIPLKGPGTLFCKLSIEEIVNFNIDHHSKYAQEIQEKCNINKELTYQAPPGSGIILNVGDKYAPIHSAPETAERFSLTLNLRKLR